ncbi:MAG: hypothetical protein P1U74_10315 [Legionellaceae bacterium]|nr:hypothetical protein [Legionellaceae bacterium]
MNINYSGSGFDLNNEEKLNELLQKLRNNHSLGHVTLVCTEYTDENLRNFYEIISRLTPPLPCKLKLVTKVNSQLTPLFEYDRIQFSSQMARQIKSLKSARTSGAAKEVIISPAKIDMVHGNTDITVPQQCQKVLPISTKKTKVLTIDDTTIVASSSSVTKITESNFMPITRENIGEKLRAACSLILEGAVSPEQIWDNLVGANTNKVNDKSKVITAIDLSVMEILLRIRNYKQLSFGLVKDNLPVILDENGNIKQRIGYFYIPSSQQYVLQLVDNPAEEDINKYTLALDKPIFETSLQSYENKWPDDPVVSVKIKSIIGIENNKDILALARDFDKIIERCQDNRQLFQYIKSELNIFKGRLGASLDRNVLIGLLNVTASADYEGLAILLKQINSMDLSLLEFFLKSPNNYLQFATQEGIDKLSILAKFTGPEKIWWKNLVKMHQKSGADVDFNELFGAFESFKTEITALEKGNGLPQTFPFDIEKPINMQVALECVRQIIAGGPRKLQLDNLDGLDISPMGAYFASKYEHFQFISSLHRLSPEFAVIQRREDGSEKLSYSMSDDKLFSDVMQMDGLYKFPNADFDYDAIKSFYYRRVTDLSKGYTNDFKFSNYTKISDVVDSLSLNLYKQERKIGFYVTDDPNFKLPKGRISGYICVLNPSTKQPVSLKLLMPPIGDVKELNDKIPSVLNALFPRGNYTTIAELDDSQLSSVFGYSEFDISRDYYTELDIQSKSSLLYISAMACSGRRASMQTKQPFAELSVFLESVRDFASRSETTVPDIIEAIHMANLNADTCPTLTEIASLLNLTVNPDNGTGVEIINQLFGIIEGYGDTAHDIFDNYKQLLTKTKSVSSQVSDTHSEEKSDDSSLEYHLAREQNVLEENSVSSGSESDNSVAAEIKIPVIDFLDSINKLASVHNQILNDRHFDEESQKLIGKVLSLVVDTEGDYAENVQRLVSNLKGLSAEIYKPILEKLCDINVSASDGFLTFAILENVLVSNIDKSVKMSFEEVIYTELLERLDPERKYTDTKKENLREEVVKVLVLLPFETILQNPECSLQKFFDAFKKSKTVSKEIADNISSIFKLVTTTHTSNIAAQLKEESADSKSIRFGRSLTKSDELDLVGAFGVFVDEFTLKVFCDTDPNNKSSYFGGYRNRLVSSLGGSDSAKLTISKLDETVDILRLLCDELKKDSPDEDFLLGCLDKPNDILNSLREQLSTSTTIAGSIIIRAVQVFVLGLCSAGIIQGHLKDSLNKYFSIFCLSVFMGHTLNESFSKKIQDTVTSIESKDEDFKKYLNNYMQQTSGAIGFGFLKTNENPLKTPFNKISEQVKSADAIISYNGKLFYVSQQSKTCEELLPNSDLDTEVHEYIRSECNDTYKPVGRDGCCLIKLSHSKIEGKPTSDKLYDAVRTSSIKQDAVILFKHDLYYFDHLSKTVSKISNLADDYDNLKNIIRSDDVRQASEDECQLITNVTGRKIHRDLKKLHSIGIHPSILLGDYLKEYGARLQNLTRFAKELNTFKCEDQREYDNCFSILIKLSKKINFAQLSRLTSTLLQTFRDRDVNDERNLSFKKALVYINRQLGSEDEPPVAASRFNNVIASIDLLYSRKIHLSPESLDLFFEMSVENNLKQDARFPLDALMAVEDSCKSGDKQFIDNFVRIITLTNQEKISGRADLSAEFINKTTGLLEKFSENNVGSLLTPLLKSLPDFESVARYIEIAEMLEGYSPEIITQWSKIFAALSGDRRKKDLSLDDIKKIMAGLEKHADYLADIVDVLFESPPYPDVDIFILELQEDADSLKAYRAEFDLHPYGEKNKQKMAPNFATDKVARVVGGIKNLINGQYLTYQEQEKLVQDFAYVNKIGKGEVSLQPKDDKQQPILIGGQDKINLRKATRKQLNELSVRIKQGFLALEKIRGSEQYLSHPDNRYLALQLIAVMREQYYRSTGILPNSTQMLTIINALDNPSSQLIEINTSEGKSVTTALYSALMCAKGCTVFVPTSSENLVYQDYHKKHNARFFKTLGFESAMLDTANPNSKHVVGGITYGTTSTIDNYCSEHLLQGITLNTDIDGKVYPLCAVTDEHDSKLDDLVQRTLVIPDESEEMTLELSPVWMIEQINRFVESDQYTQIEKKDGQEAPDVEADARNLERYLYEQANIQKNVLDARRQVRAWSSRLKGYLNSAAIAHTVIETQDFRVIDKDPKTGEYLDKAVAVPLAKVDGSPVWGNLTPDGIQQFLHEKLNHNGDGTVSFPVEIEPICLASISSKGLTNIFKYRIGLSATLGNHSELIEQRLPATQMPPHNPVNRKVLPPQLTTSSKMHDEAIINAIRFNGYEDTYIPSFVLKLIINIVDAFKYLLSIVGGHKEHRVETQENQPVLVMVDADRVSDIYKKLVKQFGRDRVQEINGTEPESERDDKISRADSPNMITVGPTFLGRGVDYSPTHPEGLYVIDACPGNERMAGQKKGRSARKGKKGKYLSITPSDSCYSYDLFSRIFGLSFDNKEKQVTKRQELFNLGISRERYYEQELDDVNQVIFNQFNAWRSVLLMNMPLDSDLEKDLWLLRAELIKEMRDVRREIEEKSKGETSKDIKSYENTIVKSWNRVFIVKMKGLIGESINSEEQGVHLKYLQKDDIGLELNSRRLKIQYDRKNPTRTRRISQDRTDRIVAENIDGNLAVAKKDYSDESLDDGKKELLYEYAEKRLKSIFLEYPELGEFDSKLDIPSNLHRLFAKLNDQNIYNEYRDVVRIYPAAKECIKLYNNIKDFIPAWFKGEGFEKFLEDSDDSTVDESDDNSEDIMEQRSIVRRQKVSGIAREVRDIASKVNNKYMCSMLMNVSKSLIINLAVVNKTWYFFGIKPLIVSDAYKVLIKLAGNVVKADDEEDRVTQSLQLYKELNKYKLILDQQHSYFPFLSYFFGTKDLKLYIDESLASFEYLTDNNDDYARLLNKKLEEGTCEGYFQTYLPDSQFDETCEKVLANLKEHAPNKKITVGALDRFGQYIAENPAVTNRQEKDVEAHNRTISDWNNFVEKFKSIKSGNNSLAVFDELLCHLHRARVDYGNKFLSQTLTGALVSKLYNVEPIGLLIQKVTQIRDKIKADNPGISLPCLKMFLDNKEASFQRLLGVGKLEILVGSSCGNYYYDVVIKASAIKDKEILEGFIVDEQANSYREDLFSIKDRIEEARNKIAGLEELQRTSAANDSVIEEKKDDAPKKKSRDRRGSFMGGVFSFMHMGNTPESSVSSDSDRLGNEFIDYSYDIELERKNLKLFELEESIVKRRIPQEDIVSRRFDTLDDLLEFENILKNNHEVDDLDNSFHNRADDIVVATI